jgi:uncharacterized protein (TIGR03083 family)
MTSATESVPPRVRRRVLDAARRERAPKQSVLAVTGISPVEAFRRTADALDTLLRSLDDVAWHRPALRDLDVQGLIGHLLAVEQHAARCFAAEGDASLASADHVASTDAVAVAQAGRDPAATRAEWREAVDETLAVIADLGDLGDLGERIVEIHGLTLPVNAYLVARAFELWTHDHDIRRAVGREPSRPDAATLQLMTALAARMVPVGVRRTAGHELDRPLRLVLTGDGGGVWDLGPEGQSRVARIVADGVAFCRLVANRAVPGELGLDLWGDRALIDTVLDAARSLALD